MSQAQLAAAAGITAAAISQFESGQSRPSAPTLVALARALMVPPAFLGGSDLSVDDDAPAFFRSLRSTTPRVRRTIRARAELVHLFVQALERFVDLPEPRVPRYPLGATASQDHAEATAEAVRRDWNLPPGPIEDVVRAMERAGVITVRLPVETERVDAFSVPFSDRPITVLGADKDKRDRSRFDAAHELGHLVMHGGDASGTKVAEEQAHWFAAAFLMPADDIRDDLLGIVDWDRLMRLKSRWQVSMGALLRRKRSLGLLSQAGYVSALKQMSARGWTKNEPVPLGLPEQPALVPKAVALLGRAGASLADVALAAALHVADVEAIVGSTGPGRLAVEI